jgi:hypothetical protein
MSVKLRAWAETGLVRGVSVLFREEGFKGGGFEGSGERFECAAWMSGVGEGVWV